MDKAEYLHELASELKLLREFLLQYKAFVDLQKEDKPKILVRK